MNNKLLYYFNGLERDKQGLLEKIKGRSDEQLNFTSSPNRWSVNQIIAHLITAEMASLSYMKKKSLGIKDLQDSGLVESLKMFVLKVSQRLPLRYKAPKYVVEHTPKVFSLDELEKGWCDARDQLKFFLETIEDVDLRKKIYKHPVAGYLDSTQALMFFREHIHHHTPQIERLLKETESLKSA